MSDRDDDEDLYRRAVARPPALVALAKRGPRDDEALAPVPREVPTGAAFTRRLSRALDLPLAASMRRWTRPFAAIGFVVAISAHHSVAAALGGLAVFVGAMVIDLLSPVALSPKASRCLAQVAELPFPVKGYDVWLAAEHPLLDVYLRGDVDQALLADAARALDMRITVEWRGRRVARIVIPPRVFPRGEHGGDRILWAQLLDQILVPLHQDAGIERVEMGGTTRALPPGPSEG